MKLTQEQKENLREQIVYLNKEKGESYDKIASGLTDVSESTVYNIARGDWGKLTDKMIRKVASQLNVRFSEESNKANEWQIAPTEQYNMLNGYLEAAQRESIVLTIVGDAGCGKTTTLQNYKDNNDDVCVVSCSSFWTKKIFLKEIMKAAKIKNNGGDIYDMEEAIVSEMIKRNKPLIAFDEIDKLSDSVLYFYITFYNKLHGKCGIVSCSTPYLVKRLERGVKLGKLGYEEIKSRMGVIRYLPVVNEDDIEAVCVVNGVTDKAIIKKITDTSDNDLRYAQPKVIAAKNLNV